MKPRFYFAVIPLCAALLSPVYGAVTCAPVVNCSILGGQYWTSDSSPDSFGGNIDVFITPVLNFSPATALLPIYTGTYSGTKDVRELVGGGTLTREVQDHSLAFKFVRKAGDWKLKARTGYKLEYLKETADEAWGSGLFDYQKLIGGIEAERNWPAWNGRAGLDYYAMHYPNYQSLASEDAFETSLDTTTFSELAAHDGEDVLDYAALAVFLEASHRFSQAVTGFAHYDLALKNFKDQRVILNTGEAAGSLRRDDVHYLTLGMTFASPRMIIGVSDSAQYYDSSQNSFDMSSSGFTPDFYDYFENTVSPNVTFLLGDVQSPVRVSFFWDLAARRYSDRPARYENADPTGENIRQTTNTTGFKIAYPLMKGLSARFSVGYRDASSNMKYEKNYQYNYYTLNYLAGITWEL